MSERDLVLVGGGHTHALLIRQLAMKPLPGVRVTLVSESTLTPYSGMLPGLVAGHYTAGEVHIDLNRLCRWAGIRFVRGRVTGLEPERRRVRVDGQAELAYDRVSLDTGSTPDLSIPGAREHAVGVKPVSGFYSRWRSLIDRAHDRPEEDWAVVGAGAGGVELILAMAHRLGPQRSVRFHLVYGGAHILQGYPKALVKQAERALHAYGIRCHPGYRVARVTAEGLIDKHGRTLGLDQTLWCTSASAPDWPAASGLETSETGFVAVNEYLQSRSHPDVFAAGDIAEMTHSPRPKAGVYAVRQAPFLYDNLKRAFAGEILKPVRLQTRFLSLLSLGGRRAVGHKGNRVVGGAWVWRWKDRIDRAFMRRLTELDRPMAMSEPDSDDAMHCAGCGSKLGPALLQDSLSTLPVHTRPGLTPALGRAEDASRWQPTPGLEQIQSLDGFRAFSDDLDRLGRASVNHALSDLYAMGAEPVSAQAWVNLAFDHPRLQRRDFERLMHGVATALRDNRVALAGGHSTEGRETHLGLVVNGESQPGTAWTKTGARPGDVLVLTKPLGTGVILAADMAAQAPAEAIDAAWDSMLTSNRTACEVLKTLSPHAVTDVTGFGLLGHLLEMLDGEALGADLKMTEMPQLPGALSLLKQGWHSSLAPQLAPYRNQCRVDNAVREAEVQLLLDPQTSGGLLVALSEPDSRILQRQCPGSRPIGRFENRTASDKSVRVGP